MSSVKTKILLWSVCFHFVSPLRADERVIEFDQDALRGRWSPIVLSPGSRRTKITRKLFTEKDYQLAILPTLAHAEDYFKSIVVQRDKDGFRCLLKRIAREDVVKNGYYDLESINDSVVEVQSAPIDSDAVGVLTEFLRVSVSKSVYHDAPPGDEFIALDGQGFDVYVKGRKEDLYGEYSGSVVEHFLKSGRSCSTIVDVLTMLVVEHDERPLGKLVGFLRALEKGDTLVADPFLRPSEPEPDFVFPPIK